MKYRNMGKLISVNRKKANLTQTALAKMIKMQSPQFISNIERGICPLPPQYWAKLAKSLRVRKNKVIDAHLKDEKARLLKLAAF